MDLVDVNVLVYSYRQEAARHDEYRSWLLDLVNGDEAFGLSELVLNGFIRVVTHPRVFDPPSPLEQAFEFADAIRSRPQSVPVQPGPRHWDIFRRLCRAADAKGSLVPDAYLAALAIESGSEWVTTDRDYSRFPDLRWRHPLDS
ncbi:MAG TPA: type II toxin-antitoxin system VapC family toxin [Acidimicrobiia bacterium]|nr:type II toxin-antitoxin system VapC family toxin [Acidimicrobiia bacterium]